MFSRPVTSLTTRGWGWDGQEPPTNSRLDSIPQVGNCHRSHRCQRQQQGPKTSGQAQAGSGSKRIGLSSQNPVSLAGRATGSRSPEHSPTAAEALRETVPHRTEKTGRAGLLAARKEASPACSPRSHSQTRQCRVRTSTTPGAGRLAEYLKANAPRPLPAPGTPLSTPAHAGRRPGSDDAG